MNNQDIFNLIEQNHNSTIEILEAHKTAINAETKASADALEMKINGVIARQDIANHRTSKLEDECESTRFFKKSVRWKIIAAVAVSVVLAVVVHEFGLLELLNLIK